MFAPIKICVMIKRIPNHPGYPPDLQDTAVQTVLAQGHLLRADWAGLPAQAVPLPTF
jgi:hypothetical protein